MMAGVVSLTGVVISFAPALANHLWQSTAFAAVAAGLALALKKNQARARYWIWMSASVKLLLPFALLAGIASHWVKPRAAAASTNAGMYVAVEDVSEPFSATDEAAPVAQGKRVVVARAVDPTRDGETVTNGPPAPVAATQVSDARPGAPRFVARVVPVLPLVGGAVWFAGFAAVLVLWCVRWRRIARTMREAAPVGEGREIGLLRRTERAAGLKRPIELRVSAPSMEPGVFGIVRPVLAWPTGISHRLDDAHLEAILAHEVCHVGRRDNLTAALHMFVEAVFWFHPMVWWVGARLVEERERACDEEVLRLCRQPEVYAESILKVCEFCVQSPLECVSGVTGADLKKRVIEIMTKRVVRKLTLGKKLLLVAVGMVVVAVPIVLGQAKAARRFEAMILAPKPVQAILTAVGAQTEKSLEAPKPDAVADAPAFEVASIRPTSAGNNGSMGVALKPSGRVAIMRETVEGLIYFAYLPHIGSGMVEGGPDWVRSQEFDINAKVEDAEVATWGPLSDAQRQDRIRPMIRTLLAERFHVKLRSETRVTPVYALVQVKGGAKLKVVDAPPANLDPLAQEAWEKSGDPGTKALPGSFMMTGSTWTGNAIPISTLMIEIVANARVDRMVVDQTGLKGSYDFTFKQSREKDAPPLLDQIEDQLGLRLESRKAPVKTYVIDSAEKPSVDGAASGTPPPAGYLAAVETAFENILRPASAQDNTKANYVLARQDAGGAPAPPPQVFHFPQATLSSRGKKTDGPGIIDLPQPGFAAEITLAIHGTTDWLQSVQVISRSAQVIVSVRMGWAYVLPTGSLEFHQGEVQTVQGGAGTNNNFQLGSQNAPVRADVKDFIAFVEQVTLKDGTVINADHDKIASTYKDISEGKPVARAKTAVDPNSTAAQNAGLGPQLTPGLKPISFDVVSFRRTERQGPTRVDLPVEGDFIAYHGVPIERLILFAHIARKGYVSISGEPEWAKTDLYEFTAKVAPEDVAEWKQMTLTDKRAMVATLLADVLKLKVHQDTEPHPVYDLIVAKGGSKLTEYQPGDTVKAPGGQVLTGKVLSWFDPFTLVCQDTTMAELVNSLSGPNRAGRVVIDKTGLPGAYNFTVPIPYAPLPQQLQDMSDAPSMFEGLKALGLQMVKSTGVIDRIIVDHVERPAENQE